MKTKQTAIESIKTTFFHYAEPYPYFSEQEKGVITKEELFEVLEQAKEMEKEQIKDAFVNGFCNAQDTEDKSLNADTIFYRTRYGGNK